MERRALVAVVLLLAVAAALATVAVNTARGSVLRTARDTLTAQARQAAELSRPAFARGDEDGLRSLAQQMGLGSVLRVTFLRPDGSAVADSAFPPAPGEGTQAQPEVAGALVSGQGSSIRFDRAQGEKLILAAAVILEDGSVLGVARVSRPRSSVGGLSRATVAIAATAAALAALGVGLVTYLSVATRRGVREAARTVRAMAAGDLDQKLYPRGGGEVIDLARAINEMAESTRATIQSISREHGRLNAILTTMADGVVLTDEKRVILMANPAFEKLFAVPAAKAMGRPLMEVVLDHEVFLLLERCLRTGEPQRALLEIGPERRFFQVQAAAVQDGPRSSALVVFQDQTAARRLDKTRREFVSNVSHELRTPLASMKALVETLEEGALEDKAVARSFLGKIKGEIDRMVALGDELLDLSQIESGRMLLKMKPVDLAALLSDVLASMRPQAGRHGVALSLDVAPDLPQALADPGRVRQVVVNLLDNAMRFTPPGGQVAVSARQSDSLLLVRVLDTGIGISQEDLPHVFERFYKVDKSRSSPGSGLGLAIAKHIVLAHKGEIWAESQEGRGSTFCFTLPAAM